MISERNTKGYIGGSDAVRVFGGWETETFKKFWRERLTGESESMFDTIHTATGNIMEAEVLTAVGVPRKYWNASFEPKETIAGINTDAFDHDLKVYHEVKTALVDHAYKWILGGAISSIYMQQIQHGLYVTGASVAKLHVLLMTREEKENPFMVEDVKSKIHTFEFSREFFDSRPVTMAMYGAFIGALTYCYRKGLSPTDDTKQGIIKKYSINN